MPEVRQQTRAAIGRAIFRGDQQEKLRRAGNVAEAGDARVVVAAAALCFFSAQRTQTKGATIHEDATFG
jgi:hypothetical protein